jgi:hypothetical protein
MDNGMVMTILGTGFAIFSTFYGLKIKGGKNS